MTPLLRSLSSSQSLFVVGVVALAGVLGTAACSSSDSTTSSNGSSNGSGNTNGGQVASASDCASRCEAKFSTCGASADQASSACSEQVCGGKVTTEQLSCLEKKSCDEIAGAESFAALCPTKSGSGDTPSTPAPTCGSATCGTGEYCLMTYDAPNGDWTPGRCSKVPAACAEKSGSEMCSCMSENSDCPTSGLVHTKCSQGTGGLSFGCN